MIYEYTYYDVKPRTLAEAVKRIGEAYEMRSRYSPMVACWQTEIGPLNRILQIFPYEDLARREEIRLQIAADGRWPPPMRDLLVSRRTEIMVALPCSPPLAPGDFGPFFDFHSYSYPEGELDDITRAWGHALPNRLNYGPVLTVSRTELGQCNRLVHIMPYRTLNDYTETRGRVAAGGQWPPSAKDVREGGPGYELLAQESMIFRSAPYSPIR